MNSKLVRIGLEEAELLWKMQVEAFQGLYAKYQDTETSPATEKIDKIIMRLKQPFTYYYFIVIDEVKVGAIRVVDKKEEGKSKRISPIFIMEEYRNKTGRLIEAIRKVSPKTEFLLIASTLPNELAATEPHHFWAHQDEYSESLKGLEGMGVAIADIQAVQKEIGKRKRYIDITGNWLNHPNDYLARILAQVVIKTLGM